MRAVVVEQFGSPEGMRVREVPTPDPGPGQVLIAVAGAGVNPVDTFNRVDPSWAGLTAPCVLGYDVAGRVHSLGDGVDELQRGQPVMAMTAFPGGQGGYAEYVVVDTTLVAALPESVDLVDAASIPLAAGTALEVLDRLHPAGSSVLVLGASGGVGLFLVQLAAAAGLRVVGVGRQRSHAVMHDLGAIGCVDYTRPDAMDRAAEMAGGSFDAVADLVGGPMIRQAQPHLRDDGLIVAIATPELDVDQMIDANQTFHGVLIRDDGDRTRELADLYGTGRLRTHVTHRLPLEEAAEAHRLLDSGEAGGKIVLTP